MLTTGESKLVFAYSYVGSYINVIPFNLDHRTGKLSKFPKWKNIIWCILFSLMLLQTGLNDLQWIYDRIADTDVQIMLVSMQLNFALNPLVYLTTIQWALIRERDLLMYVFNQVYTEGKLKHCGLSHFEINGRHLLEFLQQKFNFYLQRA